jgi:hypothetical protein
MTSLHPANANARCRRTLLLAVLLAITLGGSAGAAVSASEVTIHTDVVLDINGTTAIPDGLFGVTAYDGASAATEAPWVPTLRRSGIRWAGLPGHAGWVFEKGPGPSAGWADSPEATKSLERIPAAGYAIPQCLRAWRDLGIEPMLYLLGYPEWLDGGTSADGAVKIPDYPTDPLAAAAMWAEYVALMRRADPQLTWLHLGNEPNASWFKLKHDGKDWAALYRAVAQAVRARNPGVRIGGPTLCWPLSWPPAQKGAQPWYTWTQWAEPIIAAVGDQLDFVDFHLYEASAPIGVEEVQTVVNALWLRSGRRIPVMISEYGVYLTPEDLLSPARVWRRRVATWQEQVMDFLETQPDNVLSLQPHDLFADAGGKFTFLKSRDPADQYALARVYQVWSAVQGTRLLATSSQPQVRSVATLHRDALTGASSVSILLVNTASVPQAVDLHLAGPASPSGTVQERFARLVDGEAEGAGSGREGPEGFQNAAAGGVNGAGASTPKDPAGARTPQDPHAHPDLSRIESGGMVSDRLPRHLILESDAVRCLTFGISAATPRPDRSRWHRTFFGDVVHRDFPADKSAITVHIPLAPAALNGADSARLQLGLLGARSGDVLELRIDGQTLPVAAEWFQSIPLAQLPTLHDGQCTATITLITRGHPDEPPLLLRLGSLVLDLSGESVRAAEPPPSAPDATAPILSSWSLPGARAASALEDCWSGMVQQAAGLPLNEGLAAIPAPVARMHAACTGGVQASPCQALLFRAPRSGWYKIRAAGQLTAFSNPSAGHALLSIAVIDHRDDGIKPLAAFPLNLPGGFGKHPQSFDWSQTIQLTAGWRIAFAVQAVSPGPANAGAAEITWSQVHVDLVDQGK